MNNRPVFEQAESLRFPASYSELEAGISDMHTLYMIAVESSVDCFDAGNNKIAYWLWFKAMEVKWQIIALEMRRIAEANCE